MLYLILRARLHETQSELELVQNFTSVANPTSLPCQFFGSIHMNLGELRFASVILAEVKFQIALRFPIKQ